MSAVMSYLFLLIKEVVIEGLSMCQVHAQGPQSKFGKKGNSVLSRCLYSDTHCLWERAYLVAQLEKNLPANAGDMGLNPGLGISPGEGNGNPL